MSGTILWLSVILLVISVRWEIPSLSQYTGIINDLVCKKKTGVSKKELSDKC